MKKTHSRNDSSADDHFPHDRVVSVQIDSCADGLVAIKSGSNPSGLIAVERESLILSQIHHPNVVEVIRTERTDGCSTLITQFSGRATLADCQPANPEAVARTGATLLGIVAELHEMGWIHGRLIDQHCIVGCEGNLTLCAFGAAHRVIGTDPRIGADVEAAVDIIRSLAQRLSAQHDRRGRKSQRQLNELLASWEPDRVHPFRSTHQLRLALTALAGEQPMFARPSRFVDPDTSPHPAATPTTADRSRTDRTRTGEPRRGKAISITVAAIAGLFGTIVALRYLGGPPTNPFDAPTVTTLGEIPQPVAIALALVRIVAFLACVYGVALTATTLAALLTRRPDLERAAVSLAPPFLRKALVSLVGLGVLASGVAPESGPGSNAGQSATAPNESTTITTSDTAPDSTTSDSTTSDSTTSESTVRETAAPTTTERVVPQVPVARADTTHESPSVLPRMWVIEHGDHLWKVAASTLASHLGRRPSTDEVGAYWRQVLELNRASLVDPDNPDLVVVGQVIELPPLI